MLMYLATAALLAFQAVVSGGRPGLLSYLQAFDDAVNPCHDSDPACRTCTNNETACGHNFLGSSTAWYCNYYGIACTSSR
jgi:hypothetical protein